MPNAPEAPVEPVGLPDDDVDALFSRLIPFSNLAVAVSGGADSLCLLILLSEWRRRTGWPGTLEVLCVDHGLRPESAAEAAFVQRSAQELGVPSTILRWTADKPRRNLQEAARNARYQLMAEHMRRSGAQALLLAHHLDDQAETFLDRLTRGSGVTGLSAMAADAPGGPEGLHLLRPFLQVPRRRLEASLLERGRTWCRDPSNTDPRYKRSRLRKVMALLADEGLTVASLARTADNLRRAEEALRITVAEFYRQQVIEHPAGPLKLDRGSYRALAEDLRLRLLAVLIGRVTGTLPRPRLRQLASLDHALLSAKPGRKSLSGSLFELTEDTIFCWREPGRTPPAVLELSTGSGVWDNRYRYTVAQAETVTSAGPPMFLGPLVAVPTTVPKIERPAGWPKSAFDCAPVVWAGGEAVLLPGLQPHESLGNFRSCKKVALERLPFQVRLAANFWDDTGEIR